MPVTGPAELQIFQKDNCIFQSGYQDIKTTDSKEMAISPGVSCWEKEKVSPRGDTCLPERGCTQPAPCQSTFEDKAEVQTSMGQWCLT